MSRPELTSRTQCLFVLAALAFAGCTGTIESVESSVDSGTVPSKDALTFPDAQSIDGGSNQPDAMTNLDAAVADAAAQDANLLDADIPDVDPLDAAPADGSPMDAEPMDAEPLDAEPLDAEPLDAEPLDAEPLDAEPMDAQPDAGTPDGAFTANFLWQPITFAGAVDHGFGPMAVPVGQQQAPGAVELMEVGTTSGLTNAVGGGNSHGVGIGFIDVDNDGYEDIFIANGAGAQRWDSELYINNQDGTFTDVTDSSGVRTILGNKDTYSVAAADYDMDGDLDLYIGTHPFDILMQNDGAGNFTDVTAAANAGGIQSDEANASDGRSKIVSWGDYNNDGFIDVVVASSAFVTPQRGYLLENQGNGTFADVTTDTSLLPSTQGNPCAVFWSDFDNDGDQDLWIWNDRGNTTNRVLLRNDPDANPTGRTFVNITAQAGVNNNVGNPMGIDGADINRDGYLDYYISDIGGNELYLGSANGTFTQVASQAGVLGTYGWGLGFEDFNADTWSDIFLAQEDTRPYLTFTHGGVIPPTFTQLNWPHSIIGSSAHNVAAAFADYDHNGSVDIVTATTDGSRINLYRNDTNLGTNRWLEVRIPSTPGTLAKGGISARVVVKTGNLVQFRDINGGSSRASQNATSVRFGLGQWTGADWVAALWPDGREVSALNVQGNQVLLLTP